MEGSGYVMTSMRGMMERDNETAALIRKMNACRERSTGGVKLYGKRNDICEIYVTGSEKQIHISDLETSQGGGDVRGKGICPFQPHMIAFAEHMKSCVPNPPLLEA